MLPLTNIAIAAIQPDRAASALSLVNVSWGIGAVIWPMAVRSFGTSDSVAIPTAALAIACALMAIACRVAVPAALLTAYEASISPPLRSAAPRLSIAGPMTAGLKPRIHMERAFRERVIVGRAMLFGTLIFLYVGTENAVAGWVAEFARRMVAGATTAWALAPMAFWAALTTGRLLAAVALKRVSESALIRGGLVLATLGVLAIIFAASTPERRDCRGCGRGTGAVSDLSAAVGAGHAIGRRHCASVPRGPLYAAGGLGGAVMPWVVGAVSSALGDLRAGLAVPLGALARAAGTRRA